MFLRKRSNSVEIPDEKKLEPVDSFSVSEMNEDKIWNWLCQHSPQIFLLITLFGIVFILWWLL